MMHTDRSENLAQKIRAQYTEPQTTRLDELKALDRKVKRPAVITAWCVGVLSALLLGSGMSLIMTEIAAIIGLSRPMVPGLILGLTGLVLALVNYPLYTRLLQTRRRKFAPQILALTDELTQG